MANNKQLDDISYIAVMAKAEGLSYAQYVAAHSDWKARRIRDGDPPAVQEAQKATFHRVCEWCGTPFKTNYPTKRFCCPECADKNHERARWQKKKQNAKEE